jgi:Bacterial PH domain/zinc-ribbon domain
MTDNLPEDLNKIMGPNEQVELYIKQKIYHPKINIDSVVITNERIILRHPHDLRIKKDYTDFNYQDISNVVLDKGIMRSTVKCILRFGGDPLTLNDLPNSDAEKAYGIVRENLVRYQAPFTAGAAGVPPFQQQQRPVGMNAPAAACRNCGASISPGQRFCPSCGAQL